jgi:tetratricopeptide (TPR) repeat protein
VNQLTGDRAGIRATFGSRHGRSLLLAVLALLVGLGAGRFLTYSDDAAPPATPAAAVSPADRITRLEQETTARPEDPRAWYALGAAYVQQSITTGDPALYDLAARALDRSAALDPDAAATRIAQGTLALSLHRFQDALTIAESVIEDEPRNPGALAVLVDAQVELGAYDAAATTLQQLLDIRPDLVALARVSYLRQLVGDLGGALTAIRQARTAGAGLTVELANVMAIEGEIQLLRGDFPAALAAFDDALRTSPDLASAHYGRARALHATGQSTNAIELLEQTLDRQPTAHAAALLGELQEQSGAPQKATESFSLAAAIHDLQASSGQVVDLEAALFEADHGDPVVAVELARAAYEARSTIFTADAMAWALHRDGRSVDAVPYAEQAVAHGAPDPSLRVHAAAVFAEVGEPERAREVLSTATATGGWLAPSLHPIADQLATDLGLQKPVAWR